jgi:hypothetical protein
MPCRILKRSPPVAAPNGVIMIIWLHPLDTALLRAEHSSLAAHSIAEQALATYMGVELFM